MCVFAKAQRQHVFEGPQYRGQVSGYSYHQPIDSIGVVSGGFGNVGLKGPIDLNQMKPNTCVEAGG